MNDPREVFSLWEQFRAGVDPGTSYERELSLLDAGLEEMQQTGKLTKFEVMEDDPPRPLDRDLHRLVVNFSLPGGARCTTTGVDCNREKALLKAYAEAVERLVMMARPPLETAYSFREGAWRQKSLTLTSSNGVAFHRDFYSGVLNGFLELLERHYLLLHWYTRTPPVGEIDIAEIGYLVRAREYFFRQGARFRAFLLNQAGPVKVVVLLATAEGNPALDYQVLISFAAHHDIGPALAKAYAELNMSLLSPPRKRMRKAYPGPEAVTELNDHLFYYQFPERIACFDFLTKSPLPLVKPGNLGISRLRAPRRMLDLARDLELHLFPLSLPAAWTGFHCCKCWSPQLQEISFGARHGNLNVLKTKGYPLDLSHPHPLA